MPLRPICLLLTCFGAPLSAMTVVPGAPGSPPEPGRFAPVRAFGSADGLPQNTVYALAQDRQGYVYAGTQDGLARYDGVRFERVRLRDGATREPAVRALLSDAHALWIGTDRAGLWRLGSGFAELRSDGARLSRVLALSARSDGGVWVATTTGIQACTDACRPFSREIAVSIHEGRWEGKSALFAGTDGKLLRWELAAPDPSPIALTSADGLPGGPLLAVTQWGGPQDEDLWVGGTQGLARLRADTLTVWTAELHPAFGRVRVLQALNAADGQQKLWVGTFGNGLSRFDRDDRWVTDTTVQGLPENYVYSLLQSGSPQHAQIWIGTASSGIARQQPGNWMAFNERQGLPHHSAIGVGEAHFPDIGDSYWIGTIAGSVRYADGRWQPFLPPALASKPLYAIAERADGGLWLATSLGLIAWDAAGIHSAAVGAETEMIDLHWQRAGDRPVLWAATDRGLAQIDARGQLLPIKLAAPIPPAFTVSRLLSAPTLGDSLFAATSIGVLRIHADGRIDHHRPPCLPDADVRALALGTQDDGSVELWAGGRGGVTRLRFNGGETQCEILDAAHISSNWIYQLLVDHAGSLYAFGYVGVTRLRLDQLHERALSEVVAEHFTTADGLPDLEFNRGGHVDRRGRIWAANVGGAVVFDPAAATAAAPGPAAPLRLTRAHAAGQPIVANSTLAHADAAEVEFAWRLLAYSQEHRIRYRTQLVGLEPRPGPYLAAHDKIYSRLPAGHYAFRVWARDAAGTESGPIEFKFAVAPRWWETAASKLASALALVLAGLQVGRWRSRRLRRQAEQLESLVAERTEELALANARLETLSLTDVLTGARNRRAFYQEHPAWTAAGAHWLIALDIDHFKQINDRLGHAAGDSVLIEVSRRLSQTGLPLYRMGGEEFLLLARAPDVAAIARVLSSILHGVADEPITLGTDRIAVSCSIGAARHPADTDASIEATLKLADDALYRAKQSGRRRGFIAAVDANDEKPAWLEVKFDPGSL